LFNLFIIAKAFRLLSGDKRHQKQAKNQKSLNPVRKENKMIGVYGATCIDLP